MDFCVSSFIWHNSEVAYNIVVKYINKFVEVEKMDNKVDVLVGMSGGIDSSVSAYFLKEKGYNVTGITMKLWKADRKFSSFIHGDACFSPNEDSDIYKAQNICKVLGIKHVVLDVSEEYEKNILLNFRNEYLNGRTPNPCVWCNQKIKFGALITEAKKSGINFDFFATGHYARIKKNGSRYDLLRALDLSKDQSYFLYRLSQNQLSSVLFPLGDITKKQVKEIDFKLGFHDENQKESQDFYSGPYSDLLDVSPQKGKILYKDGTVLGEHEGYWNYTIGQRKGLGIAWPNPLYVISINSDSNTVTVGERDFVLSYEVYATDVNFVSLSEEECQNEIIVSCQAKIRSNGALEACNARIYKKDNSFIIKAFFEDGVFGSTPGQSLVLYKDDSVLCGGIIYQNNQ